MQASPDQAGPWILIPARIRAIQGITHSRLMLESIPPNVKSVGRENIEENLMNLALIARILPPQNKMPVCTAQTVHKAIVSMVLIQMAILSA